MSLAAIHFLIGFTVGTETPLQEFDKEIGQSLLLLPRPLADRAIQTPLRLLSIFLGDCLVVHRSSPIENLSLTSFGRLI